MIGATGMGEREAQFYADVAPHRRPAGPPLVLRRERRRRRLRPPARGPRRARVRVPRTANGASRPTPAAVALEQLAGFHARFEDAAERDRVAPWLRHGAHEHERGDVRAHALRARRERGQARHRLHRHRRALRRAPRLVRRDLARGTGDATSTATRTSATCTSTTAASASSTGDCRGSAPTCATSATS